MVRILTPQAPAPVLPAWEPASPKQADSGPRWLHRCPLGPTLYVETRTLLDTRGCAWCETWPPVERQERLWG